VRTDPQTVRDQDALLRQAQDRIGSIFIRHDGVNHAWRVLDWTYRFGFRLNESQPGYIHGDSRCGKTETAHRWIKHMTGKRPVRGSQLINGKEEVLVCQLIEGNGVKLLYLDLTNGASPLEVCKAILRLFNYPKPMQRMKQTEATTKAIGMMIARSIDVVIVDETQQCFKGDGEQAAQAIAEWLLPMANAKCFKMIFIGARNLDKLFKVQSAEARHFGIALLEPFSFNTKINKGLWTGFLEKFFEQVPFDTGALRVDGDKNKPLTARHVFNFYFATRGAPGELSKFVETSAISAFERNEGVLPHDLLVKDFADAFEFLWCNDKRMKGANPFTIAEIDDIPSIPLSSRAGADDTTKSGVRRRTAIPGGRIHGR
jgi:AAA domain